MEGPQFSTLSESRLYRSWGMDIIGMTNLQEAKLAREAEICYTTIALVTDYDCWHPEHDSVTVDMSDKTGHGIGYGLLGLVLLRAFAGARKSGVTLRIVLLTIVCATAYGVSDEFHQRFVPGRTADVHDVAADAIGASIAALGAWAILKTTAVNARRL